MKIREKIPSLLVNLFSDSYRKLFKSNKKSWSISMIQLANYEKNTVGFHLYTFLNTHHIQLMPQFESHDIFHMISGYSIHTIDEIRLQYFLLGNGKRSVFQFGTILLGTILLPEYMSSYFKAFRAGKNSMTFYNWQFEYLLKEDFEDLKKMIFKKRNELKLFNHIHF